MLLRLHYKGSYQLYEQRIDAFDCSSKVQTKICRNLIVSTAASPQFATDLNTEAFNKSAFQRSVNIFVVRSWSERARSNISL